MLLRGAIVNRTYGRHKKPTYLPIFTDNIWSYLLWSHVIIVRTRTADGDTGVERRMKVGEAEIAARMVGRAGRRQVVTVVARRGGSRLLGDPVVTSWRLTNGLPTTSNERLSRCMLQQTSGPAVKIHTATAVNQHANRTMQEKHHASQPHPPTHEYRTNKANRPVRTDRSNHLDHPSDLSNHPKPTNRYRDAKQPTPTRKPAVGIRQL